MDFLHNFLDPLFPCLHFQITFPFLFSRPDIFCKPKVFPLHFLLSVIISQPKQKKTLSVFLSLFHRSYPEYCLISQINPYFIIGLGLIFWEEDVEQWLNETEKQYYILLTPENIYDHIDQNSDKYNILFINDSGTILERK